MHRFFLDPERIQAGKVCFDAEISHQIRRVLRLKPDDQVMVLDGMGNRHIVQLVDVNRNEITGRVLESQSAEGEPTCQVTLYVALTQREKFEWILQKCTELGVSGFVPVTSERTIVQKSSSIIRKAERRKNILREAAEQSRRGLIPKLAAPLQFSEAVNLACHQDDLVLFFWEEEGGQSLREVLLSLSPTGLPVSIGLFIGPEGGFSEKEVQEAVQAGCLPVSLGKRILRMETAAVAAAALVMYEAGEME